MRSPSSPPSMWSSPKPPSRWSAPRPASIRSLPSSAMTVSRISLPSTPSSPSPATMTLPLARPRTSSSAALPTRHATAAVSAPGSEEPRCEGSASIRNTGPPLRQQRSSQWRSPTTGCGLGSGRWVTTPASPWVTSGGGVVRVEQASSSTAGQPRWRWFGPRHDTGTIIRQAGVMHPPYRVWSGLVQLGIEPRLAGLLLGGLESEIGNELSLALHQRAGSDRDELFVVTRN